MNIDPKFIKLGPITCARSNDVVFSIVIVGDSLLLMAVRVNDGLELEVTDPKEYQGDVEQEE